MSFLSRDLKRTMQAARRPRTIGFASAAVIAGLGLSAAGSLAFEISLTRIFAIQQFHSFAFLVVSLAVMGTAASGVALSLRPDPPSLARLAFASALAMGLCYAVINFVPFDSYVILWDPRQFVALVLYCFMSGLPFFFVGWATGACLAEAGERAYLPYAANLVGAGAGCAVALGAHTVHGPISGLGAATGLALLGAAAFSARRREAILCTLAAVTVVILGLSPPPALELRLSPYKPLSSALLSEGAVRTLTLYGASERMDGVESESTHVYPGLSLNAGVTPPPQVALYIDGDGPLPITGLAPHSTTAENLARHMPGGLAYELRPQAETLIVDPGAGEEALVALSLGAEHVAMAMDEPLVLDVLEGRYRSFSGDLLQLPGVTPLRQSARSALRTGGEYDVIDFALSDPYRPITAGAYTLSENYTLTVEAIADALSRLDDDGLLVVTRWLGTPPSEETRLFNIVLTALDDAGLNPPRDHVLAYRGMRTATVLAGRRAFTPAELTTVRQFLEGNGFDPIVLPDLKPEELNRFNQLPEDTYNTLFESLLSDPKIVEASYPFDIRPTTDDKPYFFHFFRWSQIPDILRTLGTTWEPFGGSGYLVLIILLAIMTLISLPLAIAPRLLWMRGARVKTPSGSVLTYFAALGAGYLLVEIPLIQQSTLLVDRPSIALAVVLFTLLIASGLGSLASSKVDPRLAGLALVVVLLTTLLGAPVAIHAALGWTLPFRIALAVALCGPVGFMMGMPFVAGLRSISRSGPGPVAWVWAVNGAASGVSGVLAAMIGLTWGLRAAMGAGLVAYATAALAGRWVLAGPEGAPTQPQDAETGGET
jgi:hypothetical protein